MELKTFEKENRYIVIKRSDLNLMTRTQEEVDELDHILYAIQSHRTIGLGKPPLKCVVVESDWPEYELVWKMIQDRMEGRTPSPSASKASPSGCKSESAEKVIAAAIERDGGDHDDCCKYYRVPSQGCNCGHDAFIEALAAYQKESE